MNKDRLAQMRCRNIPGSEMYDYFLKKLPADLPLTDYQRGLSCFGFARLLVLELGGVEKAKILRVQFLHPEGYEGETTCHAYVVDTKADSKKRLYNRFKNDEITYNYVIENGDDFTNETFSWRWQ